MPRFGGYREKHHQPFYDHLIRVAANTAPTPTLVSQTRLFATGTSLGTMSWTNLSSAGALGNDESFVILAMRCYVWYRGTSALTMYTLTQNQLYLSLVVGPKTQFVAPSWYFPQGGGTWGWDSATPIMSNGTPETPAILKFGKSIPVLPRQTFYVQADLYDLNTTSLMTTYLNASSTIGDREIAVYLDGIHTRDVL